FSRTDETTWTGALDRSPCGTGTSARLALLRAKGELGVGDSIVHESLTGATFRGEIVGESDVAAIPAITPRITGRAWLTGIAHYILDVGDPLVDGFTVPDIWPS